MYDIQIEFPQTLSVTHNGAEWSGTFNTIVGALFASLLSDAIPIGATLTLVNPSTDKPYLRDVVVSEITDRALVLSSGETIDRNNDLLAVSIP